MRVASKCICSFSIVPVSLHLNLSTSTDCWLKFHHSLSRVHLVTLHLVVIVIWNETKHKFSVALSLVVLHLICWHCIVCVVLGSHATTRREHFPAILWLLRQRFNSNIWMIKLHFLCWEILKYDDCIHNHFSFNFRTRKWHFYGFNASASVHSIGMVLILFKIWVLWLTNVNHNMHIYSIESNLNSLFARINDKDKDPLL